jgi:hypothetical protein
MKLFFIMAVLLCLSVYGWRVTGSGNGQRASLSCFSVTSPATLAALSAADRGSLNADSRLWIEGATCDAICAAKGAACVSSKKNGSVNPGFDCADALDPLRGDDVVIGCRCCAVAH